MDRRAFLGLTGVAAVAGCSSSHRAASAPGPTPLPSATGAHQAGIVTPHPAQGHLLTVVCDVDGPPASVLAALGHEVLALTGGTSPLLAGMAPGDLTVTVGVGPRLHPATGTLPAFEREQLASSSGGDLMLQLCASDPLVIPGAASALLAAGGRAVTERWRQGAYRGPYVPITKDASAPRNLLGFVDGIIGPRTSAELDADVWIPSGPEAGGTVAVVRRMEIDVDRFLAQPVAAQEAVFGRRRATAAPLSGGTIATDPDLGAKTPAGAYVIPADAHLRRANPASTGVPPMLRRSYSMDAGLLFISFQRELDTFVKTLRRMDVMDALMGYTTTTHSGSFLVLPGFSADEALGSSLFS